MFAFDTTTKLHTATPSSYRHADRNRLAGRSTRFDGASDEW